MMMIMMMIKLAVFQVHQC